MTLFHSNTGQNKQLYNYVKKEPQKKDECDSQLWQSFDQTL